MTDQTRIKMRINRRKSTGVQRHAVGIPPSSSLPLRRHRTLSALDLHRRQTTKQQPVPALTLSPSFAAVSPCELSHSVPSSSMRKNPYVGWFRHAPDTTLFSLSKKTLFRRKAKGANVSRFNKLQGSLFASSSVRPGVPMWTRQQEVLSNYPLKNGMTCLEMCW